MAVKRSKGLTASKARERLAELEQSTRAREARIAQVESRISKDGDPEPKLLDFRNKLMKKQKAEQGRVAKLQSLLAEQVQKTSVEFRSVEDYASEEIAALHKSYENLKVEMVEIRAEFDGQPRPTGINERLGQLEERLDRREVSAARLYEEMVQLQSALEQERQTTRRLSRKQKDRDEHLETFRETLEEDVLATVDLGQKLDEIEERLEHSEAPRPDPHALLLPLEERLTVLESAPAHDDQALRAEIAQLRQALEAVESVVAALEARPVPTPSVPLVEVEPVQVEPPEVEPPEVEPPVLEDAEEDDDDIFCYDPYPELQEAVFY